MDREWIVNHLDLHSNFQDVVYMIVEYCKETGRKESDIKHLLECISFMPQLLVEAAKNIQQFYFRKYNICILTDQQNNIIKLF